MRNTLSMLHFRRLTGSGSRRVVVPVLLLAGLAGCPARTVQREPAVTTPLASTEAQVDRQLVEDLAAWTTKGRQAALALEQRAPEVVPYLNSRLNHPNWQVRFQLVQLLDRIGDPRSLSGLVERVVVDESDHVRYRTLAVLKGGFPSRGQDLQQVLAALSRFHARSQGRQRWNAAYAMGSLGDETVLAELKAALRGKDRWRSVEAVWALEFVHDDEVVGALVELLQQREGPQLWSVIRTLGAIPGPDAEAALRRALELPDQQAVQRAERALRNRERTAVAGGVGPSRWDQQSEQPAELILAAGDDAEGQTLFWYAVRQLGLEPGRSASGIDGLTRALTAEDSSKRLRAAVALAHLGVPEPACAEVLHACMKDCGPAQRALALSSLAGLNDQRALSQALKWRVEQALPLRQAALEVLARWPGPEDGATEGLLWILMHDPDPDMRRRAALWLGRRGGESARLSLQSALRFEQDRQVRRQLQTSLDEPEPSSACTP